MTPNGSESDDEEDYDLADVLFPSSHAHRDSVFLVYELTEQLALASLSIEFYISIVGVLLTIVHLIVLTRKAMMTSSIMSIMVGVAVCDLTSMLIAIGTRHLVFRIIVKQCSPPVTLSVQRVFWVLMSIRDDVIRCSMWLAVLMALIRFLVLKFPLKHSFLKMSTVSFGFYAISVSFLLSTLMSIFYFLRNKIVLIRIWRPAKECPGFAETDAFEIYEQVISDLFSANNGFILRVFMFVNGSISKIVPCFLLPILSILLTLELRSRRKSRRPKSQFGKNSTERTTSLVIFMAFSFFVAALPAGFTAAVQVFFIDLGFFYISANVDHLCYVILTANSSIHCLICFSMSSQYRKTTMAMLRIREKETNKESSQADRIPSERVENAICPLIPKSRQFTPFLAFQMATPTDEEYSAQLFPSCGDPRLFYTVYSLLERLAFHSLKVELYIDVLGVLLTVVHLTILTRKSMMTSSIMSIMIGVACCDLTSMAISLGARNTISRIIGQECNPPITLFSFQVFEIAANLRYDVIRCSTWLGVLMALIRYLALKFASENKTFEIISSVRFGFYATIVSFVASSTLSVFSFLRIKIVKIRTWKPALECPGFSETDEYPVYEELISDLFSANNGLLLRVFQFTNGILSKIVPCLLLPLLTILLIAELRRTEQARRMTTVSVKNNTERTTGLVVFVAVSFFVAALPTGIATTLQVTFTDLGFTYISTYVDHLCNIILTLNASLHCLICFAMSSQYRKTAKRLFRIPKRSSKIDPMTTRFPVFFVIQSTMATHATAVGLFPSSENPSVPYNLYLFIENLSISSRKVELSISIVGVLLTTVHLAILTRKTTLTSSSVSIMIGVACCDMISMMIVIGTRSTIPRIVGLDCTPPITLLAYNVFWVFMSIRDDVIRCSTWLGVLMALIRYLVLKMAAKNKSQMISSVPFGFYSTLISFLFSSLLSVFFFLRVKLVQVRVWKPAENCPDVSSTEQFPVYEPIVSDVFKANDGFGVRVFQFTDGILSKASNSFPESKITFKLSQIAPCLLLPLLTILLIAELRRANEASKSSNVSNRNNTERTTALVIFMAVSFFVAALPTGIASTISVVFVDLGYLYMATYVENLCTIVLTLNASLHCLICFAMSSQYRRTAKQLFRIPEQNSTKIKNVATMRGVK